MTPVDDALGCVWPAELTVTETKKRQLVPTGHCFCGCGQEVGIDRWCPVIG